MNRPVAESFPRGAQEGAVGGDAGPQAGCIGEVRNPPQPGAEGLLKRRVTGAEYRAAAAYLENVGIQSGYTQEAASARAAYTPDFDLTGLPQEEE